MDTFGEGKIPLRVEFSYECLNVGVSYYKWPHVSLKKRSALEEVTPRWSVASSFLFLSFKMLLCKKRATQQKTANKKREVATAAMKVATDNLHSNSP